MSTVSNRSVQLPVAEKSSVSVWRVATVLGVTLAWTLIANAYHSVMYEWEAVPASALLLAGAVAALLWREPPGFSPLRIAAVLVCGQGFQSAGLPMLNRPRFNDLLFNATPESFTANVLATTIFSFAFLAAIGATLVVSKPAALMRARRADSVPRELSVWVALALVAVTIVGSVISTANANAPAFGAFGAMPQVIFNDAWILPVATAAAVMGSSTNRLILFGSLATMAAMAAWTTMLGVLILPMRAMVLTLVLMRRRGVAMVAAFGTVVFLVFNPAKSIVRHELTQNGPPATLVESAERWQRAILATWTGQAEIDEAFSKSAQRFDYNSAGAAVFAAVPYLSPYKLGETYSAIPTMLIPRAIMPGKQLTADYRFKLTVEIGLQSSGSENTSVALPAAAEAYWNFGWLGVLIVPVILGLAAAFLYRFIPEERVTAVGYVVLITISVGTFNDMLFTIAPQFVFILLARVLMPYFTRPRRDLVHRAVNARTQISAAA